MKVLIIGSKGMLGQELVAVFSADHEVTAWDREEIDITRLRPPLAGYGGQAEKIQNLKPDIIINAAAYNNVDGAESEPEIARAVNGHAVGNLAAICRELNILMVHYSSEYVFDGEKQEGYIETDQPNPLSAYGASKFLGERELQKNTDKFYLIRLSRLFGREPKGTQAKKSFVSLMLDLAKRQAQIDAVNEEVSCPTYALDIAKRTRDIIEQNLPYGIYHSPNRGAATWHGFAAEIFKIRKINVKLNPVPASYFPRPAQRPRYGILLNTKLPPMRPWQEALREFLMTNY